MKTRLKKLLDEDIAKWTSKMEALQFEGAKEIAGMFGGIEAASYRASAALCSQMIADLNEVRVEYLEEALAKARGV